MGILKVKVGTSWIDIGGGAAEEVFVGPDDPIVTNPTTELWYDTDDTTPVLQTGLPSGLDANKPTAPTVPMQWFSTDTKRLWTWDGSQWVDAPRSYYASSVGGTVAGGGSATIVTLNLPAITTGRIMVITWSLRVAQTTSGVFDIQWNGPGSDTALHQQSGVLSAGQTFSFTRPWLATGAALSFSTVVNAWGGQPLTYDTKSSITAVVN